MNNQAKTEITVELSLKDYVNTLDDSRKTDRQKFREELSELIFCSPVTMVQKIRENRWTQQEKEAIARYLDKPVEILFPEEL